MRIPILHLEDGFHHFDGIIKQGTMHFYRDEVYPNDIYVSVDLNKFDKNINCTVGIHTQAHYTCDRCLSEFDQEYKEEFKVLFHLGPNDLHSDEEDVINLSPEQKEIDLTPMVKENLVLSIPMKWICSEDCKGICPGCGADLNKESCKCTTQQIDARWEQLNKFKSKHR